MSNNLLLIILGRAQLRQAIKEMTDIKPNKLKIFLTQIYVYVQAALCSWTSGIFAYFAPCRNAGSRMEAVNRFLSGRKEKPENRLGRATVGHIWQLRLGFVC